MTRRPPKQSDPQRAKTIACSPFSPDRLKLTSESNEREMEKEREIETLDFSPCTVCVYVFVSYL